MNPWRTTTGNLGECGLLSSLRFERESFYLENIPRVDGVTLRSTE